MRKGLGTHPAALHFLYAIVSNRRRGAQAILNVSIVDNLPLLGRVSPDSRKTVGLEFQLHRQPVL